ncbi:hypothetical protein [Hyphobacterium sp.]|uniref:hypothetical protein n=1 Tax=Hyphobacterium sp. TaxID=2004662 RepID=UPI003B52A0AA
MFLLGRIGSVSATLFMAFILATAMLVALGLYAPTILNYILDVAELVERGLTHTGLPDRYNNFVRLFLGDEQLAFLFFTIIARIFIAIIGSLFTRAVTPKSKVDRAFG